MGHYSSWTDGISYLIFLKIRQGFYKFQRKSEKKQLSKMYGLLLENMGQYVIKVYGDKKWNDVLTALKIENVSKILHKDS